jgi:cyanophycinase
MTDTFGLIALLGSGEYLAVMDPIDRRLLDAAGKARPRVVCLPTAAGQEGPASVGKWMRMGVDHFTRLGADVSALPVIDRAGADDAAHAAAVRSADLIYFSGGNPGYLHRTLDGSAVWAAVLEARAGGAALAGCSAGAMILGEYLPERFSLNPHFGPGFGLVPKCVLLPHFDRLPARNVAISALRHKLNPDTFALGVDENTALVGWPGKTWEVMGAGSVFVMRREGSHEYKTGAVITLPD